MGKVDVKKKSSLWKFLLFSSVGFFLFLIPIPYSESFTIPVGILIDMVKSVIHEYTLLPVVLLIIINASLTVITKLFKPAIIMNNGWMKRTFDTTPLYIVSRIIGAVFAVMFYFKVGPEAVISDITGAVMFDLMQTLVSVLIVISFLMPLLTEFGIMEFVGILVKDVVRPLFTVSGRSAIDLVTSWLGASSAAVLLTKQQYDKGFYTGREAATIMTNFPFVSVPFAYIVASVLKVEDYFTQFYLICAASGLLIAMIMPRIYPLNKIPDEYNPKTGKQIDESIPEGKTRLQFAFESAAERAAQTTAHDCLSQGVDMFTSIIFTLSPVIIAWGIISWILVECTPVFSIIAYPMGLLLKLLGITEPVAAPATLVGFADMFIPPLMLAGVESLRTRFIVGAATLLQLIYMTEVGIIILQSDVPLGFKDLIIIFLERTIFALLLVTLFTKLVLGF
jgi:nucleoside recognition membrane protein YjiH